MKKFVSVFMFCVTFIASQSPAYATKGSAILTIKYVGSASSNHVVPEVRSQYNVWFNSSAQLGACPMDDGFVYFENPSADNGIYSLLMSAYVASKQVKVYWDDGQLSARGYCEVSGARMQ